MLYNNDILSVQYRPFKDHHPNPIIETTPYIHLTHLNIYKKQKDLYLLVKERDDT